MARVVDDYAAHDHALLIWSESHAAQIFCIISTKAELHGL